MNTKGERRKFRAAQGRLLVPNVANLYSIITSANYHIITLMLAFLSLRRDDYHIF